MNFEACSKAGRPPEETLLHRQLGPGQPGIRPSGRGGRLAQAAAPAVRPPSSPRHSAASCRLKSALGREC